ncbi:MAG: hypothetical protein K6G83_03425 [Lachnospiraceae bacterium]|nr:hypothetical protein [Lachnospiraceae bacterium]
MKRLLYIILLASLMLCACEDEDEKKEAATQTENAVESDALQEEAAVPIEEAAAAEREKENTDEKTVNSPTQAAAPEEKHEQDPDALAALVDESKGSGETGEEGDEDKNDVLELMDYLGDIDSLIDIMKPEHVGTGMMSTDNVDFCFGVEGIQDFYLNIRNEGDENLRFLDIKIGDTEAEVEKKLSVIPYDAEGIELDVPTYYIIWNSEAEYPFIALELFFGYDEPIVGRAESQTVEIVRRTDPAKLLWWELTDYFPDVAAQNAHYMSLSGNYAVYISDIQHYIADRVQCAFTDLVYYGDVSIGGEGGIAFACLDENGQYQDFYYVYFEFDRAVVKVDKSEIY